MALASAAAINNNGARDFGPAFISLAALNTNRAAQDYTRLIS